MCGVSGLEDLFFLIDPLFGGARNNVYNFFHRGMAMKFVGLSRWHGDPHKHEFFGIGEAEAANPFVWAPGQFFNLDIVLCDELQEIVFGHR